MEWTSRQKKQWTVFGVIAGALLLFGAFSIFIENLKPSCNDEKRNQGETGVDCGGPCAECTPFVDAEPLKISETAIVPAGQNIFDALVIVDNPNSSFGSPNFLLTADFVDESGKVVARREAKEYILPNTTREIIFGSIESTEPIADTRVSISDVSWEMLVGFTEAPRIPVLRPEIRQPSGSSVFAQAYGLVRNESPYDFNRITVSVVLRDNNGKPLALHKTEMDTVAAGQERDFLLSWHSSFPFYSVSKVDMRASADVFNSLNFTKKYYPPQRFSEMEP